MLPDWGRSSSTLYTARHTDMDLVGAEDDKELAEGVANGKWDFGLFGGGRDFRALQNLQLPVRELTLTKTIGALSTEISGGVGVLDQAPNPNAAKLFANWWYSRAGQTADIESTSSFGPLGAVSLRSDVTLGTFPEHLKETLLKVPEWRAAGPRSTSFLVVYELNDEWFQVRESTEVFFNDLYKELGYDAWRELQPAVISARGRSQGHPEVPGTGANPTLET